MTTLIDTHCHLYLDEFRSDLDAVISRAEAEGVGKFFLPAIDSSETAHLLETENRFKGRLFAMMGLHPCSVKENYEVELRLVEQWLAKRPFAAVGEIGLDYYWDITFKAQQQAAFQQQIQWAIQYSLPVVIHSRNSLDDCIDMVTPFNGKLTGIYHCFSGNMQQAAKIMDIGFYMGIGGVLTYKNSGLAEVVKEIPLENIVLETDAPYLTPVPFRGKRNESSYLKYVVQKLAEIKNVSTDEIARITTGNVQKIFKVL